MLRHFGNSSASHFLLPRLFHFSLFKHYPTDSNLNLFLLFHLSVLGSELINFKINFADFHGLSKVMAWPQPFSSAEVVPFLPIQTLSDWLEPQSFPPISPFSFRKWIDKLQNQFRWFPWSFQSNGMTTTAHYLNLTVLYFFSDDIHCRHIKDLKNKILTSILSQNVTWKNRRMCN